MRMPDGTMWGHLQAT